MRLATPNGGAGFLRGLNEKFWHRTVTTEQVEEYLDQESGLDLQGFFDQYLRTTEIPVLRYGASKNGVQVWWENVVSGFELPVPLVVNGEEAAGFG